MVFRSLVFAAAASLAGCGSKAISWPKSAGDVKVDDWKKDGGESLEARSSTPAAKQEVEGSFDGKASGDKIIADEIIFSLDD